MLQIERRTFQAELRVEGDEQARIVGHAALFNTLSQPIFGFREMIAPGAFRKTLQTADVRALLNHDPNYVLGRNRSGTLRLEEDDIGLAIDNDPPDTQWARDLLVSMRRGDINQMSFAFRVINHREKWEETSEGLIRTVQEAELFDVSVVTYPAYEDAEAHVRSVLSASGIEFDALTGLLIRRRHGLPVTDQDRELIAATRDALSRLDAAPPPAGHPADADKIKRLRRRLELVERI